MGPNKSGQTLVKQFKGRVYNEFSMIKRIQYTFPGEDPVGKTRTGGE